MKQLELTDEAVQLINALANVAFKNAGLDVYGIVKKLEIWLSTAVEKPSELPKEE